MNITEPSAGPTSWNNLGETKVGDNDDTPFLHSTRKTRTAVLDFKNDKLNDEDKK